MVAVSSTHGSFDSPPFLLFRDSFFLPIVALFLLQRSAVLNLTDTVGVTQNFCSPRNFGQVWLKTRSGRKKLAWKWLNQLEVHYPELAKQAKLLNKRDNFRMKYDPKEQERQEMLNHRRKLQRTV